MPRTLRKPTKRGTSIKFEKKINNAVKGKRLYVKSLPPPFTAAPWNALIIVGEVKGKGTNATIDCFSVNDLILAFQKQTGIKLPTLCLRMQKFYAWEMTNQPLEVAVDEMPDGTPCSSYSDSVTVLACYPGKISFARVGYKWPLSSRAQVKTAAEGSTVIFRTSVPTAGKVLFHIHVLWSTGQATLELNSAPSSFAVCKTNEIAEQGLSESDDEYEAVVKGIETISM